MKWLTGNWNELLASPRSSVALAIVAAELAELKEVRETGRDGSPRRWE